LTLTDGSSWPNKRNPQARINAAGRRYLFMAKLVWSSINIETVPISNTGKYKEIHVEKEISWTILHGCLSASGGMDDFSFMITPKECYIYNPGSRPGERKGSNANLPSLRDASKCRNLSREGPGVGPGGTVVKFMDR
jgi:hypothetical protein